MLARRSTAMKEAPSLPATWPEGAPLGFQVMARPSGAICNLNCAY